MGKCDIHMENNILEPFLIPCINIICKWSTDLNVKTKTIHVTEVNIKHHFYSIGIQQVWVSKKKITLECIKIKHYCLPKSY